MRVSDLTVEQLRALIRSVVREELHQAREPEGFDQRKLLQLEPLHVGRWPEGLQLLSRDEYYC
jgi:hypothetical protein